MHPNFLGKINVELGAPQVPLVIGETFGEGSGPWRLTGSEPRPAQIWEPEIVIFQRVLEGHMGHQTVPLTLLSHPIYTYVGLR